LSAIFILSFYGGGESFIYLTCMKIKITDKQDRERQDLRDNSLNLNNIIKRKDAKVQRGVFKHLFFVSEKTNNHAVPLHKRPRFS
jgi:hypothetical protein